MKRKLLPVAGASILATSLLVGCSGRNEVLNSTDATKSTSKVTEVTFWHSMGGKGGEAIETLVSEFNSSQSNIKVVAEYQGSYDDSINKLKSAALGNSGPDIMQLYEVGTKWMIDSGYATPMQELIDRDGYDISSLEENILDYYNKYYVPNNSVISICGNFNFEEIVEKIKDKFKTWEAKEASINTTEPKFNPCIIKKNKDIEQVNLAINLKAIPMINDREVYALSVVNNVFGGSISSRLFQKIREEKGLVYSIYSSQTLYQECGELGIFASTSNENVEEVYKLILDEIDLIRNEYISLQEIHESKEQLKGSYMLDRESTSSRMMSNGKNLLMRNKVDDEQDIIDYINNVEYQDVVEIIEKVFNKENIGVCIVGKDVENISL